MAEDMAGAVIVLPAVVNMGHARAVLAQLLPAIAAAAQPRIDASALQTLDSAAIAMLLECRRQAAAAGKTLTIVGAPPKLGELARLYGVEDLLALD